MKIRTSFVTNSSSSSFILIGKSVGLSEIDLDKKSYTCVGDCKWDGLDVFELTKEIFDYMKSVGYSDVDIYETAYIAYEGDYILGEELIKNISLTSKYNVISGDADYHSTDSLEQFKETYRED